MELWKISSNMPRWTFFTALMLLGCRLDCGDGARILSIFPAPSISHQSVFRKLTLELNKRGHELVVVTTDPIKDSTLKNYKEIDISFLYKEKNYIGSVVDFRGKIDWYSRLSMLETIMSSQVTQIFSFPEFKKLYEPGSGEKFDLVLMEIFFSPAFMALAERFKAPLIGIASANLQLGVQYGIGEPILPSHPSILEMTVKGGDSWMPWQRLQNFIYSWRIIHYYRTVTLPKHKELAEKYLGIEIKDLHEMEKNISLIFVNQQKPISFVRPNVPKVVEIGGFHVSDKRKPLPKDLQKTLDEATQGFIYMSLGSNVKSNTLSKKTRDAFITAFSKLPYKVIWKFENDELEGKPDNVIILKWAPQQAILAHPNIKLFVYQGGLQSTEEAVSHGVPLVGLPVMGDQDVNVNKMVSLGVAKKLEITDVTKDDLLDAINTVARNASYKQKMMNLRSLLKDKPQDSLKSAVWWTEHVIRHGGAPYLHSTTAEEPWYQRQDMDIIAFLSAAFVITLILTNLILYKCVIYTIRAFAVHSVDKKKKRS
ncbi:UDP-glucosyltransferase 2-like [Neodiprion fabricii]|uniref:UDP-glucosyltransferase 2-like n=1 Tax=Neodiprion fabricii TaxID=2872261 RepID=UPI001ED94CE7|nr:UDP-glucosyltransferase 2-like [Neodiprion fabricii]